MCGLSDDEDFTASAQCCACGGGLPSGTTSCETYSVSGSKYWAMLHGKYVASGTCDGKTLYKCEDSASEVYLYYSSKYDDWSIGSECGSDVFVMYTVGSNSGDLGLAQWTEGDPNSEEWVETSTISVRCLSASYSFRPTEDGGEDASRSSSKTPLAVLVPFIFAVCLAVGIVAAALLSKRCFYPTKADGSEKPPRKIIIELPAAPSSGQAAAPAEDDEEQPDVITN